MIRFRRSRRWKRESRRPRRTWQTRPRAIADVRGVAAGTRSRVEPFADHERADRRFPPRHDQEHEGRETQNPARPGQDSKGPELVSGRIGKALKLSGENSVTLPLGNFDRFQPFSIGLWIKTPDEKDRAVVLHRSRAWTDAGSRGYELLFEDGKLSADSFHFWPGNAIGIRTRKPVAVDRWVHITMTYDGSSRPAG